MAANGKLASCGCVLRPWGTVSWSQANLWKPLFGCIVCEGWINTASNWSEPPKNHNCHLSSLNDQLILMFSGSKNIFCLLRTRFLPPLARWVWTPCHGRSMRWSAHCQDRQGGPPKTARAAVSHGADRGRPHETHCPLPASPQLSTGKEIVY